MVSQTLIQVRGRTLYTLLQLKILSMSEQFLNSTYIEPRAAFADKMGSCYERPCVTVISDMDMRYLLFKAEITASSH